jgi:phosphodiesterase/alkaline phosphatase D-like protein
MTRCRTTAARCRLTAAFLAVFGAVALAGCTVPALAAAPETPVTKPATAVTAATALLHGELNPKKAGEAGEFYFTYEQSASECEPGTLAPEPPGTALGSAKEAVSVELTGLEPSRQYTYCVVASHEGATATGAPVTFKTLASKPAVESESAAPASPFAANLEAQVNPNNQETTYSFEYSTEAAGEVLKGSVTTVSGEAPLPPEFGGRTAFASTGAVLASATTYFYRVVAKNATGTAKGKVEEFTTNTAEAPTVDSESASAVTATDARLEAKVNPNFQETHYSFEYAASKEAVEEGKGTLVEGSPPAPALPAVSEELTAGPTGIGGGLEPGTTYFYRVAAANATGPTDGPVESFTTLAALPIISAAGDAEGTTGTSATLAASVNPDGGVTVYRFVYLTQAEYEAALVERPGEPFALAKVVSSETTETTVPAGLEPVAVKLGVDELTPGTAYEFALVATNAAGTTTGPAASFATQPPTPPLAVTGAAVNVGQLSAAILGSVDTQGLPTSFQFEFGTASGEGSLVPATANPSFGPVLEISAEFSNDLQPGTTYYYRVVASNADGTGYGEERSFTTASLAAPFLPATLPAVIPYTPITQIETQGSKLLLPGPGPKPPTRAQLLAKALKACQKKPKKQRAGCERQADKKYGPAKKAGRKNRKK